MGSPSMEFRTLNLIGTVRFVLNTISPFVKVNPPAPSRVKSKSVFFCCDFRLYQTMVQFFSTAVNKYPSQWLTVERKKVG